MINMQAVAHKIVPEAFVVINLAADKDRLKHAMGECARFRLQCTRFDAVNASSWYAKDGSWDQRAWNARVREGAVVNQTALQTAEKRVSLTPSRVAVHLSHVRACSTVFAANPTFRWIVVLEDDVRLLRSLKTIEYRGSNIGVVHLHRRALRHFGREGYAISRTGCQTQAAFTLPMSKPGDLTLMSPATMAKIAQAISPFYLREDRATFGSSKTLLHYRCSGSPNALLWDTAPQATDRLSTWKRACAHPPRPFLMRYFSEADIYSETHCVAHYNKKQSLWVPRQTTNGVAMRPKRCMRPPAVKRLPAVRRPQATRRPPAKRPPPRARVKSSPPPCPPPPQHPLLRWLRWLL